MNKLDISKELAYYIERLHDRNGQLLYDKFETADEVIKFLEELGVKFE